MNTSPPKFPKTLDMLKDAIRYTESAMIRASKVTRDLPIRRPGYYSVVTPKGK